MPNIILKSFDGSKYDNPFIEIALNGLEIGTCISVANAGWELPNIDCKEHIHLEASSMRSGNFYDTVDWNDIAPLDEELIQSMRNTEAMFYTMLDKYTQHGDILYTQRRRRYYKQLRYWNDLLDRYEIDLLLLNHQPHQGYDIVLYDLCRKRGIPTLNLERTTVIDAMYIMQSWQESGEQIRKRYDELKQEYGSGDSHVELSKNYEAYFKSYAEETPEPWFMKTFEKHYTSKSFLSRWGKKALDFLTHHPVRFCKAFFSAKVWARKISQHNTQKMYYRMQKNPDLEKPYVYVALHAQPEMSTSPLSGAFVDQHLLVQLLAKYLPEGVQIYVKEHPLQNELCRSKNFYQVMLDIPAVTLVPKTVDTFALIENSKAVATGTGTVGFQALFRGKPIFMFGHRFFQYAPGVHRIHSKEDCEAAVKSIFERGETPSKRDMRIFLKALEDTATPYTGIPHSPIEKYSQDEKAKLMGKAIRSAVQQVLPSIPSP